MRKRKQPYLTSQQLAVELRASKADGQPTEQLCNYFKMIATHMLGSSKFSGYSRHIQEDMVSAALIKCLKNVHNFKEEYADKCFNYYTRCTEHAFFEVLWQHYKHVNIERQLKMQYADTVEQFNPQLAKKIRDYNEEV